MGKDLWRYALGIVLVLVLLFFVAAYPRIKCNEEMLAGYWSADSSYLEKADLSQMDLYIAPPDGASSETRQGYLLMVDSEGNFVSNQGIELVLRRSGKTWVASARSALLSDGARGPSGVRMGTAHIVYDDEPVMPEYLTLELDPARGTLTMYDDGQIYAFLYKDNEASADANAQYSVEDSP